MATPRNHQLFAIFAVALVALVAFLAARPADAAWPGGNGPVVFAGGGATAGNGLWAKTLGKPGLRRLTSDPTDSQPQASPNGRWIVFVRQVVVPLQGGGVFPATHIFRVRTDGAGLAPVTGGTSFEEGPSFAPSGKRIVFARTQAGGGTRDIWSVRLNGSGLHQITSGTTDDRNPVFSPNGRVIAFDRRIPQGGPSRHVHTMHPDGTRIKDATPQLAAQTFEPDFSPSGNRIVFVRGTTAEPGSDLFTMRPDGKRLRRLTGVPRRAKGAYGNPVYSPDGRRVIAQFDVDGAFTKLRVINVRNRSLGATIGGRRQTRTPDAREPVWLTR